MAFCRSPSYRQRSTLYITLSMALLSIAITALVVFSRRLSSGTPHKAINVAGVAASNVLISVSLAALTCAYRLKVKEEVARAVRASSQADADFIRSLTGLPSRYTFEEVNSMTGVFTRRLGKGGSGWVYEGALPDGTKIAVKRLEDHGRGQDGERQFYDEVATISKVHHANVVCLKGFCAEGEHKMLLYEYMDNGSLDKWIFGGGGGDGRIGGGADTMVAEVALGWAERYGIAVGAAKGLAYLHEECEEKIIHLDVKPGNILLDGNFTAKVSDFGLSRSMKREESRVLTETVRGTPGYMAPEWFAGGSGVGDRSDVYSYGMVLLELLSGRRTQSLPEPFAFLPEFAWEGLQKQDGVAEMLDPRLLRGGHIDNRGGDDGGGNYGGAGGNNGGDLGGDVEMACAAVTVPIVEEAAVAFRVALWCTQQDPRCRPSMATVVSMLEGRSAVPPPPAPLGRHFKNLVPPLFHRCPSQHSDAIVSEATAGVEDSSITLVVGR